MRKKTKVLIVILASPVIIYVLYHLLVLSAIEMFFYDAMQAKSRMPILLYETDHQALLKACRSLLDQGYKGKYNVRIDPHPDINKFPKEILKLKPTYVFVHDDNYVGIEMMGGMSHFGVLAYPEDFVPPYEGFGYGDKKLIDGLWYYDDGYQEDPNYEEKIESLRPKDK